MKKLNLCFRNLGFKIAALGIVIMLVTPSLAMFDVVIQMNSAENGRSSNMTNSIPNSIVDVRPILTEDGTWIPLDGNITPGSKAEAHVTVSDTTGITIVADFPGFWKGVDNYTLRDSLDMPGTTTTQEIGKPQLPRMIEYVEIPHDIDISLEILSGTPVTLSYYNITPVPMPVAPIHHVVPENSSDVVSPIMNTFVIDDPTYSSTSFYPSYNASMEGGANASSIIMRGRRLLEVSFYPIQYSPQLAQIQAYPQLILKIEYSNPAQIEPVLPGYSSDIFEDIFESFLLNFKPFEFPFPLGIAYDRFHIPLAAEYLIITEDLFVDEIQPLVDWKTRKGLMTKVETVNDIRSSPTSDLVEDIRNYLEIVYRSWEIVPTYVLIFGDSEIVPNDYGMVHKSSLSSYSPEWVPPDADQDEFGNYYYYDQLTGRIGTDLPYFTLHGTDYVPDMLYGRVSVDNEADATILVNKIVSYEMNPTANAAYYDSILSAAFFDDLAWSATQGRWVLDGIEQAEYPYVFNAETIKHYLEGYEGVSDFLYDVAMDYSAAWKPGLTGDDIINFPEPNGFPDISFAEFCTHFEGAFEWIPAWESHRDQAVTALTDSFNDGKFLIYYLDHGGSRNMVYGFDTYDDGVNQLDKDEYEGWANLCFDVNDLSGLNNIGELPLIINIACNVGWFDGEIDGENNGVMGERFADYAGESFAEVITRMDNTGALAAIAPTRHVYNHASIEMLNGIIQAFWPGYLDLDNQPIYEMGAALLFGKMNVASERGYEDGYKEQTATIFQAFHLFGDPETQLWTSEPGDLDITYPPYIGTRGMQKFVVTVADNGQPVYYAKVSINHGSDISQVGYTNALGQVVFEVYPSESMDIDLTVTKHNYRPELRTIEVMESNAVLILSEYSGAPGERIDFKVEGFDTMDEVYIFIESTYWTEISIGSQTTYDQVPNLTPRYVNVFAAQAPSGPIAVKLFRVLSGNPQPDPWIYNHKFPYSWMLSSNHRFSFDNPDIFILHEDTDPTYPGTSMYHDQLTQGEAYKIYITVHNNGSYAEGTSATVSYARFGCGQTWTKINEEPIVFNIEAHRDYHFMILWSPGMSDKYCFKVELTHVDDLKTSNNIGYENVHVMPIYSPGELDFLAGNPTDEESYIFLDVRQHGDYDDYWNVSICGFSSLSMVPDAFEDISLQVIDNDDTIVNDWRIFTVSLYVDGVLYGGLTVNVTKQDSGLGGNIILILIAGGAALVIVAIVIIKKK
ncbi:MAG: C25 family cysteine peptidase [Candidatus Thorarchaeota archaeon]